MSFVSREKGILAWTAVIIYCILIFIGSSIPGDELDTGPPGFDKILHILQYLILSLLIFTALKFSLLSLSVTAIFWLTVAASSLYGASDEIHQLFVPFRECDFLDFCADLLGSLLGSYWFSKRLNKRTRPFNP